MRLIKRYSNRKLYDTQDKRYITLEQIANLVQNNEDIKVIDNGSGEDLTTVTLSQVLLDQEKKKEQTLPKWAFLEMIQRGSNSVVDVVKKTVFTWFENSFVSDAEIDENVEKLVRGGEITKDEAKRLKDEFKSRALSFKQRLDTLVEKRVDEILGALHIPSKTELSELNKRLEALDKKVSLLLEASGDKGGEPAAPPEDQAAPKTEETAEAKDEA